MFNPTDNVLPLFEIDQNNRVREFLGTGFFVGDESVFVTAAHNVSSNQKYSVLNTDILYNANIAHINTKCDVALLEIEGYHPKKRFSLVQEEVILSNEFIVCLEYGKTKQYGGNIEVMESTRIGNITRVFPEHELFGKRHNDLLELSFAALRGASGAPILSFDGFRVLGMIIANHSYHLIPSQIEKYLNENGETIEETKFMMPQALAVHVNEIKRVIEQYLKT